MIRLAIAEDHQSLIDGVQLFLQDEYQVEVVGTANNGEDLLEIVHQKPPHVVLTDIRMPKMDGISVTKHLQKNYPEIKVIAFTMYSQDEAVAQMLAAGAKGYLLKNSSLQEVWNAIQAVHQGENYYDPNITIPKTEDNHNKTKGILSNRQMEILDLIAQGKTSREIADELFIGVQTVDTHRKNMARKLNLQGKGELLRYALEKKYRF